jgi:hypothetical protein
MDRVLWTMVSSIQTHAKAGAQGQKFCDWTERWPRRRPSPFYTSISSFFGLQTRMFQTAIADRARRMAGSPMSPRGRDPAGRFVQARSGLAVNLDAGHHCTEGPWVCLLWRTRSKRPANARPARDGRHVARGQSERFATTTRSASGHACHGSGVRAPSRSHRSFVWRTSLGFVVRVRGTALKRGHRGRDQAFISIDSAF